MAASSGKFMTAITRALYNAYPITGNVSFFGTRSALKGEEAPLARYGIPLGRSHRYRRIGSFAMPVDGGNRIFVVGADRLAIGR